MTIDQKQHAVSTALAALSAGASEITVPKLRNDLEQFGGTNDVTFVMGDAKKGLIHIEKRHGIETVPHVIEAVIDGEISKFIAPKKTVHIIKDGYEAVLSLDENGQRKTWLLTGWDIQHIKNSTR